MPRVVSSAGRRVVNEGIPVPYGGWYPGTGNIGWGYSLTRERKRCDCDRAGLVDLARQEDGSLKRVLCEDLVPEVLKLRDIGPKPVHAPLWADVPAAAVVPSLPSSLSVSSAAAGD